MKKIITLFIAFLLIALFASLIALITFNPLLHWAVEKGINFSSTEFFENTARLKSVQLNSDFTVQLRDLRADLQSPDGGIPIKVDSIQSIDPVTNIFFGKPLRFQFENAGFTHSSYPGAKGEATVNGLMNWTVKVDAQVEGIGLEEVVWLNPDNLVGSTGRMQGTFSTTQTIHEHPTMHLTLNVSEPGGTVQARFFDILLPYLPQLKDDKRIRGLAQTTEILKYKEAKLDILWEKPSEIRVFLHIMIPDYFLNLNLNLTVRTDSDSTFLKLAEIFGLVEVATK